MKSVEICPMIVIASMMTTAEAVTETSEVAMTGETIIKNKKMVMATWATEIEIGQTTHNLETKRE